MEQGQFRDFVLRPAREDDARAVTDLIIACDTVDSGAADYSLEELRHWWRQPGFDLEKDTLVVVTPAGELAGYVGMWDQGGVRLRAEGYAHPDYRGRGVGTGLVRWSEARVRDGLGLAPPGTRVTLDNGVSGDNMAAARLLEAEGYARVRTFWDMLTHMDAPPPAPEWPEGIAVRPFVSGQDERTMYAVSDEAFRDHWGHVPIPFEEWRASRMGGEDFDPSLWFVAREGDEAAGAIRCRYRLEAGWVDNLSVRRPWRGRGLGMALLRHAFGEFYRRGAREVGLGVDAESLTGATRLYERAGMRVHRRFDIYQKIMREGAEPQ